METADLYGSEFAVIRIGDGQCFYENSVKYCNGPLRPETVYCIKLRTYTEHDYLDSLCSDHFLTGGRAKVAKNAFLPLTVAVTPFCMFLAVIMLLYHFFIKRNNRKYQMMFLNQAESEETLKSITDFPLPIKTVNKHQLTTMNLKPPIKHLPEAPSRESIVDIGVTDIFGHEIFFNQ
ncbi:hypothetical protein EB796_017833 [Bugula neritina]|uniref:Uncharacterized protein n=1 Tax=Bugula neritina TaxID=10212 RepID=A0A7J7JD59_BUGNE|nr:hypothetical protein EB796_017833 [Bugula neritina]